MRHLKLLQITGARLTGSYSLLPRELIWLCWLECPLKSLPSDFHLSELLILDMQGSKVRKLWKGTKILTKLKILNLSYSKCLVKTPNFRGLPSLERLMLVDCTSLVEVHQSIGNLKSLVLLNLEGCNSLKTLPESLGDLESLTELLAKGTAIKQLPTSARYLKKLTKLSFGGYKNVICSPDPPSKSRFSRFSSWLSPQSCSSSIAMRLDSFTGFTSLKKLDLSDAGLSDANSIDFGRFSFLEDLDLSGNRFFNLPSGISRLPKIQHFLVERCENLLSISELPSNLASISICGCKSIERVIAPGLRSKRLVQWSYGGSPTLIEVQATDLRDEDLGDNNLSEDEDLRDTYTMSEIQGIFYEISLDGGEIPEWFSHRGEGSSLSFHSPSVPDGNKLEAFLVWVVFATNEATPQTPFLQRDMFSATLKNKSNGAPLKIQNGVKIFDKKAVLNFGRNSTMLSWINRIGYTTLEESLQGVEVELNVKVRGLSDARKCWVEKCGVHLIMEKDKADSDIEKCGVHLIMEKDKADSDSDSDTVDWYRISRASTPDDQRMQSILIRELQEGKIIGYKDDICFLAF